jgi:hypothetical protein
MRPEALIGCLGDRASSFASLAAVRFREARRPGRGVRAPADIGPICPAGLDRIAAKAIKPEGAVRAPRLCAFGYSQDAEPVIALKDAEHRLMIERRFQKWPIG